LSIGADDAFGCGKVTLTRGIESDIKELEALQKSIPYPPCTTSHSLGWKGLEAVRYRQDSANAEFTLPPSGPVLAFSKAFKVELKDYDINGQRFRRRSGPVYIPKSLNGIVSGIFGLSDEPFAEPRFCRTQPIRHATARIPAGFTPMQIARHYNCPTDVNGTGQTIAIIVDWGDLVPAGYDEGRQHLDLVIVKRQLVRLPRK
jgi:hypothetical protein